MRVEEFWDWSKDVLAPGLRAGPWYNGSQPAGLAGFINDKTSRMIGYAMLRQVRVEKNSCSINSQLKDQINFCTADYTFFNEDQQKYNYTWGAFNASDKPAFSMDRVYSAFQYRTATDLDGYPLIGLYNTYWGGGYVYEMRGQKSYLVGNLTLLQKNGWIDRQTRAVIVEFTVYNPNINMFAVAEIIFEFLPSGTILKSARFDPISLLNHYTGFALFTLVCDIIYVIFIIYFMVTEIRAVIKNGAKYLLEFWSLVELAIICFSWAAVAMYAYRVYAGNKVLDFFKETSGYGYYKLQYVAFWNETLRYCLAFCAALGTLKFLKLLRFNKRISFLSSTIKHSAKELIAFAFMFFIIWCAFVQLMYLFFQDKTIGFSTFIRAMTTCLEIMLGKFQVDPLVKAHAFFGPLLFSLYNIFVVFILLNMFISIINDTFSAVRNDAEKQADDYHMVNFIVSKLKLWTGIGNNDDEDGLAYNPVLDANKNSYKDQITYFPEKIDELLYILSEVRNRCCCFFETVATNFSILF
jgi:polycystin 1L2